MSPSGAPRFRFLTLRYVPVFPPTWSTLPQVSLHMMVFYFWLVALVIGSMFMWSIAALDFHFNFRVRKACFGCCRAVIAVWLAHRTTALCGGVCLVLVLALC